MFDARSIIEQMMRGPASGQSGGQSGQGGAGGAGGLEDLLRNLTGGSSGSTGGGQAGGFSLDDLVRQMSPGGSNAASADAGTPAGGSGGGLSDILGELQKHLGGAGQGQSQTGDAGHSSGGGIFDSVGDTFRQATDGAREGAGRVSETTGLNDLIEKLGGGSGGDIMGKLQDLIANNKLGAGAALGGLGALVLGTRTGRSVAVGAAKIGALALIGGLAYKAYQNYSQGQSPSDVSNVEPEPAPQGTGFEESAIGQETAVTVLRAMMSAAAADGRLDAQEQQRITANLSDAGLDREAEEFIAREMNSPATTADLADGVSSEREAIQVYTAARLAIDPDTSAEQMFLADLGARLGLAPDLIRHIDASARNLDS